jgi:hypothetical protein
MGKQSKEELEKHYAHADPWLYKSSSEDSKRKLYLLSIANMFGPFETALDIGAGEGWITEGLPAKEIHGFEISDLAASRFPELVTRIEEPVEKKFDLVVSTGTLYGHYNVDLFLKLMNEHCGKILLISNIKEWERPEIIKKIAHTQILEASFPYHQYHQQVRVFKVNGNLSPP